jgi:protease IV
MIRILNFIKQMGFLILIILGNPACATIHLGPSMGPLEETVLEGEGPGKLLLIEVQGIINNQKDRTFTGATTALGMVEWIQENISKAEKDDAVKALLIKVNSPGGTVTSSDIILHELLHFKKKRAIPIYVQIMDLAASGGYYIALAGDKIIAHPTSLVGSIGVIAFKVNLKNLMDKIGVDWEIVKSGDKKDFMSPFRSFTAEERKLFQDSIDIFHKRFVTVIADNRPELNFEEVSSLADGRIFDSTQAMELKLIDQIGYISETIEEIKIDLSKPNLQVVTYQREGDYKSNLYSLYPQAPTLNLLNVNLGFENSSLSPLFSYLWAP